jgi:hypothetical protein
VHWVCIGSAARIQGKNGPPPVVCLTRNGPKRQLFTNAGHYITARVAISCYKVSNMTVQGLMLGFVPPRLLR